ncbi:MAG: nucleotidyltransferase domain-containing protein [Nanoarchaeota archaeon]
MVRKENKIVNQFIKVAKLNFSPCKAILFGSRARGKDKEDSDYDFILISPCFAQWEWEERAARAYHAKRNIPAAMDIICLTPTEFEIKKKQMGIIQEAVREGIMIL